MTDPDQPIFNIWRVRAIDDSGAPTWMSLVLSSAHPHETEIRLPESEAHAAFAPHERVSTARFDADGQVVGLEITELAAPAAPPLWFVELDEPAATPPATTLVAFADVDAEPGVLFDRAGARKARLRNADQVGAFRWIPESGFVDQVYVSPTWRRRSIATGLLAAAGALSFARGQAPLWGSGQRTADGERWTNGSLWADTAPAQTHILPPMTPFDQR